MPLETQEMPASDDKPATSNLPGEWWGSGVSVIAPEWVDNSVSFVVSNTWDLAPPKHTHFSKPPTSKE